MVQAVEETESQDLFHAMKLLNEMNGNVQKVTELVDGMLLRVKSGEMSTDNGLAFLEMKYHMLLNYLINLTQIVLHKATGEKIENDPTVERLVEIRTVIEKIRPIDSKLKYQVNKLIKTAATGVGSDPTLLKANPDNLMSRVERDSDAESDYFNENDKQKVKAGLYVPPKLAAMHFDGGDSKIEREKKQAEKAKKRSLNSSVMRELKEEYMDTPLEVSSGSRVHQAISKQEQERIEYEENYLTRLPTTKEDKKRRKKLTTVGKLGDELTKFGDSSFWDENDSSRSSKRKKTYTGKHRGGKKRRFR